MRTTQQNPYRIRHANESDCSRLAQFRRSLQKQMESDNSAYWPMSEKRFTCLETFFDECITDPNVCILICEYEHNGHTEMIGTLSGRVCENKDIGPYGSIEDAWVDPEHRRKGLNRTMLNQVVSFFESRGITNLQLGYIHGAESAQFWTAMGLKPVIVFANADVGSLKSRLNRPKSAIESS